MTAEGKKKEKSGAQLMILNKRHFQMHLNELGSLQTCWDSMDSEYFPHYCWAFPAIAFSIMYEVAVHLEM